MILAVEPDDAIPNSLKSVGLGVIAAIVSHLWLRYRRRLAVMQWSATLQPMAFGTDDLGWGTVEVRYDGHPTRNIHIATVQLQNASSLDFTSVRVEIVCDANTTRLRSAGHLPDSAQTIPHSKELIEFVNATGTGQKPSAQDFAYWNPRAEFLIPVINRGVVATFTLLLSRPDHETPQLTVHCVHPGVRLRKRDIEREVNGVAGKTAQTTGVGIAIVVAVIAVVVPIPKWAAVAVTGVTAAFLVVLGSWVVQLGRKVASLAE